MMTDEQGMDDMAFEESAESADAMSAMSEPLPPMMPVGYMDPAELAEDHPYSALLPIMTPSQRAAVAAKLIPAIAEFVNQKRIEKIRQARLHSLGKESQTQMSESPDGVTEVITSRQIAADLMRVSQGYIYMAQRLQREAPELFEGTFAGKITVTTAIRELDGVTDNPRTVRVKTAQSKVNRLLKIDDENPEFLDRLEALLAEFA